VKTKERMQQEKARELKPSEQGLMIAGGWKRVLLTPRNMTQRTGRVGYRRWEERRAFRHSGGGRESQFLARHVWGKTISDFQPGGRNGPPPSEKTNQGWGVRGCMETGGILGTHVAIGTGKRKKA